MELLDRYLRAVKFWLPREQKQDILAELSDDLRSQIEEQESERGRPLENTEIEAILKKSGPPMLVAGRYLPERYLIGPAVFPIYWFALRLGWMCVFLPWLVVGITLQILAGLSGHSNPVISHLLDPFLRSILINFVTLTVVFGLIERHQRKTGFLKDGMLRRTPIVRDPNRISLASSITELSWDAMLLLWWVGVLRIPGMSAIGITASPVIQRFFYWPIVVLLVCQGGIACVNIFRAQWNPRRAAIRGFVDGFCLLVVSSLLVIWITGGTFVAFTSSKLTAAEIAAGQKWITFGWSVMLLLWAAASYAARLFQDTRRATGKPAPLNWALRMLTGE
jgi:hypothetical protein